MSDQALIRLARLKTRVSGPKDMQAKTGKGYTYCRDLLAGHKSFGEKAARDIEDSLKLPRGWLDDEGGAAPPTPAADLTQLEKMMLESYRKLPSDDVRLQALNALNDALTSLLNAPGPHDPFHGKLPPGSKRRGTSAFGDLATGGKKP